MLGLALFPVALLLAGRAAAQSLPDCTRRCITVNATPGCDINSLKCMCTTASMRTAIPKCINEICGGGGGAAGAIDAWNTRCAALADNPDTTVPPPPNTTKPTPSPQDPPSTRPPEPPSSTEAPPAHSSTPAEQQTPSPDTTGPNPSGTSSPSPSSPSSSADPTSPIGVNSPNDNGNNGNSGGGGPSSGGLIGAIVGGLLGGLLVVGIIGFFLWRRRRQGDDRLQAYGVSAMSSTSGLSGQPMRMSMHKHSDSLQSGGGLAQLRRDSDSPYQDAPASIPDALAPRPLVLDTARASFPRRKGDPPPPPSFRGPVSPETELASESASHSQSYGYRDEVSPQGSTPPMVFPAGLTPTQLDLVQTMINRGLQGTAVVDVIERMLAENSTPAPQYDDDDSSRPRT